MNRDDLVGIRPDDLSDAERAAQQALFAADPDALREHEEALALGGALRGLPSPQGSLEAGDVLALLRARADFEASEPAPEDKRALLSVLRARADALEDAAPRPAPPPEAAPPPAPANSRWPWLGALVAAAAALLVIALPSGPEPEPTSPMRDRGGAAPGSVRIEAVAEAPDGSVRRLDDGASVGPGERVAFRVRTDADGFLALSEVDGAGRLFPRGGDDWRVGPGTHALGGDTPLTWRPDTGPGPRTYVASLCTAPPPEGACATHEITLSWAE